MSDASVDLSFHTAVQPSKLTESNYPASAAGDGSAAATLLKVLTDKLERDSRERTEQRDAELRQRQDELDHRERTFEASQAPRLPIIPKLKSEKD